MRILRWAAAVTLGLGGVAALAGAADTPATEDARLRRLVARLGSEQFREREAATRELEALGAAALDALRDAAGTGDAETRRRAAALADRIRQRLATDRLLAPTLISLDYEKAPLADAVVDLARRTGFPIALPDGDPAKFRNRTVTIAAGKAPFWQALQLFCHWAGLREWDGTTTLPPLVPGQAPIPETGGVQVQGQMVVRRGRLSAFTITAPPCRIALIDGRGPALPTHHTGAIRVRGLAPGTGASGNDVLLPLQVSSEPRLNAHDALDLRIERAIDDRGRAVTAFVVKADPPDEPEEFGRWPGGRSLPAPSVPRCGPVGVRLRRGESLAKRLRELAGVVTVQIFVPEPAVQLAKPADSVGKSAAGPGGVSLKLAGLTRLDGGAVRVTAQVQMPFGVQLPLPVTDLVGAMIRPWGGIPPTEPDLSPAVGTEYQGMALEDEQGKRYGVLNGAGEILGLTPQGFTLRVTATFQPEAAGVEPAKLVFTARRPQTAEVPFVLRDVPLP
jgi:hypothetical protein